MNFLIGVGCGLFFFLCLLLVFYLGYRIGNKKIDTTTSIKATEKELLEHKRKMEGMQNILSYDVFKAMGVKHE